VRRVFAAIDRGVEAFVAAIFAAMCAVGLLQVFNRFVLNKSLSWSEEFQIFCHVWIVFLAIPIAYRRGAHLAIESFRGRLPRRAGRAFDLAIELLWAAFAGSLAWLSYRVAQVAQLQHSPGLEIPMSWPYYGMVVGGVYLFFVVARRLAGETFPPQKAPS
jgi:TRAP-type C4-dicarboxylate transport system permease small subunit